MKKAAQATILGFIGLCLTVWAFLLLCLSGCKDADYQPTLQQQIAGQWVRTDNPKRHYIFGDGYATTWIHDYGTTIAPHWYGVEQTGQRDLMLVEMNTCDTRHWSFGEVGDTMEVTDRTYTIGFNFKLRRE